MLHRTAQHDSPSSWSATSARHVTRLRPPPCTVVPLAGDVMPIVGSLPPRRQCSGPFSLTSLLYQLGRNGLVVFQSFSIGDIAFGMVPPQTLKDPTFTAWLYSRMLQKSCC